MRPELRSLILDYQSRVADACRLLRNRLGLRIDNKFSWRLPRIPKKGWLDDEKTISYDFHGLGCSVMFGEVDVDFDIGPGGRIDGFNAWRLSLFAQSVPKYAAFVDIAALDEELGELCDMYEIFDLPALSGSYMFFLTSDSHP